MNGQSFSVIVAVTLLVASPLHAQSMRDRFRIDRTDDPASTAVSAAQANELTLTHVAAAIQPIQTWLRIAATLDATGKNLAASVCSTDGQLLQPGQRVRAFPPESKASMYQGSITGVSLVDSCYHVQAVLTGQSYEDTQRFVMEIIVPRGDFLAVPNEAIIEEGDSQVVYVQSGEGRYEQKTIHTGLKGELYTEVMHGLTAGEQVVTLGSFFIDADYKLKANSTQETTPSNAHHNH